MFGIGFTEIVVNVLVIVLLIFAIRWAVGGGVRDAAKDTDITASGRTARRILDERYAGGEISRDEYELMRKDIEVV